MSEAVIQGDADVPVVAEQASAAQERIYYMDAVRALAMLLGVFFHAALAYGPNIQGLWIVGDMKSQSMVLEAFAWFSHLFRMTLFFLVAGFFANFLIERRGVKSFLKNRALRIVLPFVIFWPLFTAAILFVILWAIQAIEPLPPLLQLVQEGIEQGADGPPPTTGLLWFLYNLMYFCVIAAVLSRIPWSWPSRLASGFSTRRVTCSTSRCCSCPPSTRRRCPCPRRRASRHSSSRTATTASSS